MAQAAGKAVRLFDYIERENKLTPAEAAKALRISRSLYSHWRLGKHLTVWQLLHVIDTFFSRPSTNLVILTSQKDENVVLSLLRSQYPKMLIKEMVGAYELPKYARKKAKP